MKLYLHYEGDGPHFTLLLQADSPSLPVQQAISQFVDCYNSKHGHVQKLQPELLNLCTEKGRQLAPDARLSKAFGDRDDAYLIPASGAAQQVRSAAQQQADSANAAAQQLGSSLAITSQQQQESTSSSNGPAQQPAAAAAAAAAEVGTSGMPAVVQAALDRADEAMRGRQLRAARAIYEQILQLLPDHPPTLERLARLWLAGGKADRALGYARRAAKLCPTSSQVLQLVGEALSAAGRGEEAVAQLEAAQAASKAAGEGAARQRQIQLALAKALHAAYVTAAAASGSDGSGSGHGSSSSDSEEEAPGRAAGSTGAAPSGRGGPGTASMLRLHQRCVQVVASLVSQDDSNWDHLFMYATLALDQGMLADAVRVALRLLTVRSTDAGARALLARCLLLPQGLPAMLDELGGGAGAGDSGAALAFLANCVKEPGAVRAAVDLLARAVAAEPRNGSFALNYVHALELEQSYDKVVHQTAEFCTQCRLELAPPLQSLQAIVQATEALPLLGQCTSLAWLMQAPSAVWQTAAVVPAAAASPCSDGPGGEQTAAHGGRDGQRAQEGSAAAATETEGAATGTEGAPASSPSPSDGAGAAAPPQAPRVSYSPEQLDLLGLLFTLVKVTYVCGALACTSHLCALIDPARCASAAELHTTLIRNEAAYFGCILQLLRDCPPPSHQLSQGPGSASSTPLVPPLYICGDSHCLAPAWRPVRLRGETRLLHPLLVTGCKIWHLRPDSNFYPKIQFFNTMRRLPRGTQVVMLFGEIDCREGLLLAVERCKYESLDEGISHTLDIYVDLLLTLIRERDLELFVHPVAPVLKETRPFVLAFARAMKDKVQAAARAARGRLHYLDFFEELLQPAADGGLPALQPHLHLDGTHLHPAYVQHLDEALAAVI